MVTVTAGATTLCVITLAGGAGDCSLTATQLPPGSYTLTATYGGDDTYAGSTSGGGQTVSVVPAPSATSTTLALSAIRAP